MQVRRVSTRLTSRAHRQNMPGRVSRTPVSLRPPPSTCSFFLCRVSSVPFSQYRFVMNLPSEETVVAWQRRQAAEKAGVKVHIYCTLPAFPSGVEGFYSRCRERVVSFSLVFDLIGFGCMRVRLLLASASSHVRTCLPWVWCS